MPRKSSKGNGRRNPTKYRRSAVKYNPSFVLGKIVGAKASTLYYRSMPWKLCRHPCCLNVAEPRSSRAEEKDNLNA